MAQVSRSARSPSPLASPSDKPSARHSMRLGEAFATAWDSIAHHKLRSGLTMLGMMFGVGAVIAMLSIGAGAERQALSLIDRMGVRNVLVRAKELKQDELAEVRKKSVGVSLRDVEAIGEAIDGVQRVLPRVKIDPFAIRSKRGSVEAAVYGVDAQQPQATALPLQAGRFFTSEEQGQHAQVAVLGAAAKRELYGASRALGERLKINDVWLEVIGVLQPDPLQSGPSNRTQPQTGSVSHEIYLPVTTAMRKFDHDPLRSALEQIVVQLKATSAPTPTAEAVDSLLRRLHGGQADYELVVPAALLQQSRQTQQLFNVVMGCIASISLLVGGIGIMNIMLASVLELTREIGVRRAVGARRRDIRLQFLVTSFSISVLGGMAGVLIGVLIAQVVAAYADWPTVVTVRSVALSTGVSVVVGLLSGLFPALRAAKLNPIEALRYE